MTQTPAPACLTKKCRSSGGAPASGTPAHSTNPLFRIITYKLNSMPHEVLKSCMGNIPGQYLYIAHSSQALYILYYILPTVHRHYTYILYYNYIAHSSQALYILYYILPWNVSHTVQPLCNKYINNLV